MSTKSSVKLVKYFISAFLLSWACSFSGSTGCAALPQQKGIHGEIELDTTVWAPVAYLSIVPDFTQKYTMSYQTIIERVKIDESGSFQFSSQTLPEKEHLYRIHFSKKGDPPASMIIGGKDENHFFLIANPESEINIQVKTGPRLINKLVIKANTPNQSLLKINEVAGFLDTLDYYGSSVNRDFVRQAVNDQLRVIADSSHNPLVCLYALYQMDMETDIKLNQEFYHDFLKRWSKEDSEYFKVFRTNFPEYKRLNLLFPLIIGIGLIITLVIILLIFRSRRLAKESLYSSLSVQERKVFQLLKEGKSNKEISEDCAISISTVKSHVNNIFSKLNISSRKDVMDYPK